MIGAGLLLVCTMIGWVAEVVGVLSVRWMVMGAEAGVGELAMTVGVLLLRASSPIAMMAKMIVANCFGVMW